MPSRNELVIRANVVGLDPTTYVNDSKLEQKVLWLEKRATTFTGTAATQTLTSDATASATGDTTVIGNVTYTWRTALTEVKASSTLTTNGTTPTDGDMVVVAGQTYIARTALTNTVGAPNEVLIGASASTFLDNLKSAITLDGTAGVYGFETNIHPLVTATTKTSTTLLIVAKIFGTLPNVYQTKATSAGTTLSWTGTTLTGGVANIPNEVLLGANAAAQLTNLKAAINYTLPGTNEGVNFSTGTRAHPQVTGTTLTATTLIVQANDFSVTNADISTTNPINTGTHLSWGATTLASGVAKVVALNATTYSGSNGISGDANV